MISIIIITQFIGFVIKYTCSEVEEDERRFYSKSQFR